MDDVELWSWWFVNKEWNRLKRTSVPDEGFEEAFRQYIDKKVVFDTVSDVRDMNMGLSYGTFSGNPHELDIINMKSNNIYVFELKHWKASTISKDVVFTFLGKVMDFYLKNAEVLANYKITMYLVCSTGNVDESARRLCIAYGIKLIETDQMTPGLLERFIRELHTKLRDSDDLRETVEQLIEALNQLKDYDYTFSDIFRYRNGQVELLTPPPMRVSPSDALAQIRSIHTSLQMVREKWKKNRD